MRICLVSHEYPPETADGGIGTQTWNKAHGLSQLGHSVEVLSCSASRLDQTMRTADESGITVHRLRAPGHRSTGGFPVFEQSAYLVGYTWSVLEGLHELLATRSFDLVNFPEYGADGFAFQLNRTVDNWVPVIVQLHAPLAMFAERTGWPDKASRFYRTGRFLEAESIRLADGWMASSENIANFAADHYEISREAIDVVHCGVDCDVFHPGDERPFASRRPTVLFVGNIAASKGITTVFDAVMRLRARYPAILLRIVGKKNDLLKKLLSRAAAAGFGGNVEEVPFQKERRAIAELFQQADVFASPADQENGVANVYVEAMSCGCPVIAGNTGGAPEAVMDGETGFLVPPGDTDAVAGAIDRLLSDGELRRRMGMGARKRVEEYFAQDKYIQRVLSAYGKTIARSKEKLERIRAESAS